MAQASKTLMDSLKVAYEPDWPDSEALYQRVEVASHYCILPEVLMLYDACFTESLGAHARAS